MPRKATVLILGLGGASSVLALSAGIWICSAGHETSAPPLPQTGFFEPSPNSQSLPATPYSGDHGHYARRSKVYPQLPEPSQRAYLVLANAQIFMSAAIGAAGDEPSTVPALKRLISDPHGTSAFTELAQIATKPGQLYALCGLYFTDQATFVRLLSRFKHDDSRIPTMFGCVGGSERVSRIVNAPTPCTTERTYSCELDIAGGGFPRSFRRERE